MIGAVEFFLSDLDRRRFLNVIESSKKRYKFILHAFVLMDNHYHLLIETPLANLSATLRHINGHYTQHFNRANRRVGHVLQGRYKAIVVDKNEHYLELIRYIHLNPVRAGIVQNIDEYRWSSHAAIFDTRLAEKWRNIFDVNRILLNFGRKRRLATKAYYAFVKSGIGIKKDDIFKGLSSGCILGDTGFVEWVKKNFIKNECIDKDIQGSKELRRGIDSSAVLSAIEAAYNVQRREIVNVKRGRLARNEARLLAIYLLARNSTLTQREIGVLFGGVSDVAVSRAARQCETEMKVNKHLRDVRSELTRFLGVN